MGLSDNYDDYNIYKHLLASVISNKKTGENNTRNKKSNAIP